MQEEVTITFYKIHKCGYYIGDKRNFGSTTETLHELDEWAKNINTFIDTQLWNAENDEDKFGNVRNTYFYKYEKDSNKDSLLVLWNELPDIKGEVATLSKHKTINDNTRCKMTKLPDDAVPGTASYFWFLADEGYYATVCRKNRASNNLEMNLYLKRFLETASSHCVMNQQSTDIEILGYIELPNDKINPKITPYFQASRATRKGQLDYIKTNRHKITKIIKKQTISDNNNTRVNFMQKILIDLGLKPAEILLPKEINTKYEIAYTPTEQELTEIIDNWHQNGLTKYDDTGFVFTGEPDKTHWLSGEISRAKKLFELKFIDDEIIDPSDLLEKLEIYKNEFISILKDVDIEVIKNEKY